jgi:hypothetical protein
MLAELGRRFERAFYEDHANVSDGTGNDRLAFTFIGRLLPQERIERR